MGPPPRSVGIRRLVRVASGADAVGLPGARRHATARAPLPAGRAGVCRAVGLLAWLRPVESRWPAASGVALRGVQVGSRGRIGDLLGPGRPGQDAEQRDREHDGTDESYLIHRCLPESGSSASPIGPAVGPWRSPGEGCREGGGSGGVCGGVNDFGDVGAVTPADTCRPPGAGGGTGVGAGGTGGGASIGPAMLALAGESCEAGGA